MISASRRIGLKGTASSRWNHSARISSVGHRLPLSSSLPGSITNLNIRSNQIHAFNSIHNSSTLQSRNHSTTSSISAPATSPSATPSPSRWELYSPTSIMTKLPPPLPQDHSPLEERERKQLEKSQINLLRKSKGQEAVTRANQRRKMPSLYPRQNLSELSPINQNMNYDHQFSVEPLSNSEITQLLPNSSSTSSTSSSTSNPTNEIASNLFSPSLQSTSSLAINPSSSTATTADASSTSTPSDSSPHLPPDTFAPSPRSIEMLAVLKGSLAANLTTKSHKLFTELRRASTRRLADLEKSTSIFTDSLMIGGIKDDGEPNRTESELEEEGLNAITANQIVESHERGLLEVERFKRAYDSPLDLPTYNLMIGAYLLRASTSSHTVSEVSNESDAMVRFKHAWNLFQDLSKARNTRLECRQYKERKAKALRNGEHFDEVMKKNSPDPGVDASTIGTMALGLTRLLKFKSSEVEDQSHLLGRGLTFESCFNDLIHSMVINDINYEDLTKSPSLRYNFYLQEADQESKHPSIIDVLQQLQAAAVRLGNRRFEHVIAQQIEIEMEHMEDGHEAPPSIFDASSEYEDSPNSIEEGRLRSHHMEELKPVRASSKGAIKAAVDNGTLEGVSTNSNGEIESIIPFNLLNLKASLSNLTKPATAAVDNPYERQIRLELSARDAARESLKFGATVQKELEKSTGNNPALASTQLQRWMWSWYGKLSQVLETDLKRMKKEMDLAEAEIWNRERNAKIKRRARGRQYSASKRKSAEEDQVEGEVSNLVEEEEGVENLETLKESALEWSKEGAVEAQIYPFLKLLSEDKLALITVLDAMRLQGAGTASDGIKTARAVLAIGKAVELEIVNGLMRKTGKHSDYIKQEHEKMKKNGVLDYKAREMLRNDAEKRGDSELMSLLAKFNQNLRAKIGSHLLQHFMEVATIVRKATDRDGEEWEEEQPAMYSSYQYLGGKKLGVIKLNEAIIKRLDKDSVVQTIHPRHLPMVYPPRPWLTYNHGGYLTFPGHAMRYKDSLEQEKFLAEASKEGEIEVILSGLDVLGHTPWRINEKVFSVMSDAWNRGEGLADLPPVEIPEEQPQKPDNMNTDLKARMIYYAKLKAYNLNKIANHSQRCDTNYKLEIARAYLGEKIYFPHNMDFRGRAYPIPPNLNHIGNDVCRGLLLFDESKKLGTAGLKWLRVHIANLHGFDKANFSDREQFSIDNEHLIRDSANNPSNGQRWWAKADDPWQCLSACIELTEALDHPEGPEEFESRLPVHQDGTCNGLQHYAALGGDDAGARQVNLASGDKPSDVYTGIADLVIEALKREVAEGNEMAIMLEGKVTRKVVKQTVMTTVYGVTFIGAKNQVQRQLADRGDVPVELLFDSATYLARIIMNCIGDLFSGAEEIQDWLSETAKLISRSIPPDRIRYATMKNEKQTRKKLKQEDQEAIVPKHNIPISTNHIAKSNKAGLTRLEKEQMTSVIWTTPLGLPVVQPYRKSMKKQVATALQTVFIADPNANSEVAPQKQASAFPPNFIHSLDATHMILTALECCNAGLTFASVHDSYWTHACDIETMSDLIRETFVRLHKQDILGNLKREFEKRYEGFLVPIIARDRARDSTKAKRARGGRRMDPDFGKIIPTSDAARLQAEEEEALEMENQEEEDDEFLEGTSDLKPSQAAVEMDTETFRARGLDKKSKAGTLVTADSSETSSENGKAKRVSTKNPEEYLQAKFVLLKDAIPEIPRKGNFKIDEIMSSPYFFS